jgi:hypothetical protein
MKKALLFPVLVVIVIALIAAGCSPAEVDPGPDPDPDPEPISGTVYSIEDGRILVVGGIEDVNIPRSEWFDQGKRAVYFALDDDTLVEHNGEEVGIDFIARGHQVDVYHEGFLAESYPEQGGALRVVITSAEAAEEAYTDSGRFIGVMASETGELLEVHISGVPEELPSRLFRMTDQAWSVFNTLDLEPEDEIIFRYLEDDNSEGLIFDLSRL